MGHREDSEPACFQLKIIHMPEQHILEWCLPWASSSQNETTKYLVGEWILVTALELHLASAFLSGFPCGLAGKEYACNAGDLGLIPRLGRSPGEGKGYPLQYSGLENSNGLYSPWSCKELDMTERLSLSLSREWINKL